MGRRIPYGYTRDPDSKALPPCPVRAPVLRHIFTLYTQERQGTTSIARTLEAEGAPPPRQHGWSPNALQVILANPAYIGLIRWNGKLYEGRHEPLIEKDTFDQAQAILARRFKDATLRRGNATPFLLSGLVRCQRCGRAYVGTSAHGRKSRYTYYACSTRYKYGHARCDGQRLSKNRLEHAVLAQLATIYRDGQLIDDALAQAAEQANTDRPQHEQQLAGVRADIQNLERKIDLYLQAFEDTKLDPDVCQQRIERHHGRLQALRDQEADLAQTLAAHADTQLDTTSLIALADQLDQLSSPPPTPSKPRSCCACSSRTSASTTSTRSSPPTASHQRFAQCTEQWAILGSKEPNGVHTVPAGPTRDHEGPAIPGIPHEHGVPGDGRYWARTSDLRLVEAALSQLS
jgi:hypothetical protein